MPRFDQISRTRRAGKRGGFTLPEMVVVITITAILAATAAPSLLALGTTRTTFAARQLVRDLTYARQRAIATGTRSWVVFTMGASTDTWSVLSENPASPGRAGATAVTDMATGKTFTQTMNSDPFRGVRITAVSINSQSEIGFDWQGKPLDASQAALTTDGTITLTGGRVVTITGRTGLASTP